MRRYIPNNMQDQLTEFLAQSNLIEGVDDADSLKQASYAWDYLISEKKLDHGVILKTHKILMNNQKIRPDERGYYRQREVGIYKEKIIGIDPDSERLIVQKEKIRDCLPHKEIREEMRKWILLANDLKEVVDTEQYIKESHIHFESIHPFIDGNGRVGRMLLNWQRLQVKLPILIIWNDEKKEYYEWFK